MQVRSDQEIRLVDFADRLWRHAEDRLAIHLHYARLKPHNRQEHHLRIAANCLEDLVRRFDGQLFRLSTADQVLVVKGALTPDVEPVVEKLRRLFAADPAARPGADGDLFCDWYDLNVDYEEFVAHARRLLARAEDRRKAEAEQVARSGAPRRERKQIPIQPEHLGRLVEQLASMDISSLMRRQPVCAITPEGEARPVFNELFVSIGDLQRMVMPDVQLTASTPLFAYLTQYLDQRILRALPDMEASVPLSTSININVETILSPQFLEFDQKLRAQTKKTIVLELQLSDVFQNVAGFAFARDFVRDRGYRICLDGLNHLTLPLVDKRRLGLDMQKILWAPDVWDQGGEEERKELAETVRRAGPTRLILCRCDNAHAVEFGRAIGVSLFQGRHVDALLSEQAANARVA